MIPIGSTAEKRWFLRLLTIRISPESTTVEEANASEPPDTQTRIQTADDTFYDPNRVELFDEGHSQDEARYVVLGFSSKGRLLFVSFTPLGNDTTRIIHARVAERKWRKFYEENS